MRWNDGLGLGWTIEKAMMGMFEISFWKNMGEVSWCRVKRFGESWRWKGDWSGRERLDIGMGIRGLGCWCRWGALGRAYDNVIKVMQLQHLRRKFSSSSCLRNWFEMPKIQLTFLHSPRPQSRRSRKEQTWRKRNSSSKLQTRNR